MVNISLFSAKAFTILAYALTVQAAALPTRQDKGPGFIKLPFKRALKPTNATVHADTPTVSPISESSDGFSYLIELDFGSQGQPISVILDTGSSDLWVADTNSIDGGFDNTQSSTYQDTGTPFNIRYGLGSATGEYVTDTVAIPNGPSLSNFEFADVSEPNPIGTGILGIGFASNEATNPNYVNFPQALKNDGYISKNAYSLYLNSDEAKEGEIIFGGVDTAKYEGSLTTLPISGTFPNTLDVEFDSFTTPDGTVINIGSAGILDSGTTYVTFPNDAINALAQDLGYPVVSKYIKVPCGTTLSGDLTLNFGGVNIAVPLQDFLNVVYKDGSCGLEIESSDDVQGDILIGDVVLRYAYVLYDLDDNTIGLAPVKYTSDSNVVPIS